MFDKKENENKGSKNIKSIAGFEYFYDFHPDIYQQFLDEGVFSSPEDEQYVEKKFFSYHIENNLGILLKNVV